MTRGEKVIVIAFGKRELERVVWEDAGPSVFVCTEEAYRSALTEGTEPISVAFPRGDVRILPEQSESHRRSAGREVARPGNTRKRSA